MDMPENNPPAPPTAPKVPPQGPAAAKSPHAGAQRTGRIAILVLGMHRSGTSALTRVINLLGADLPSRLLPPMRGNNEAGFWESKEIYRLNDEILASAGSAWDDWWPLDPAWFHSEAAEAFKVRALNLLAEDFSQSRLFVLKDPRMCRLLPFWLAVLHDFATEPRCILTLRHPSAVAASLEKRDGMDPRRAHLLWLRHSLEADQGSRGLRRACVAYDELLADWRGSIAALTHCLGMVWPKDISAAAPAIDLFLDRRHRHHHGPERPLPGSAAQPAWISETFAALNALRTLPEEAKALHRLDRVRGELDRASVTLGPILSAEQRAHADLVLAATGLQHLLDEHHQTLVARDARIASLTAALNHNKDKIAELRGSLSLANEALAHTHEALAHANETLADVYRSTSWRASAPLRQLGHFKLRLFQTIRAWLMTPTRMALERPLEPDAILEKKRVAGPATPPLLPPSNPQGTQGITSEELDFDAEFYVAAYPDVATSDLDPYEHYVTTGVKEGRIGKPPVPPIHGQLDQLDPRRSTLLIVSHDASRTGAPILALNLLQHLKMQHNIVTLLLGGGSLLTEFKAQADVVIGPVEQSRIPHIATRSLQPLLESIKFEFALVNSIESRGVLPLLAELFIPSIVLIHEFAAYTRPRRAITEMVLWASQPVFSAPLVAASAQQECHALLEPPPVILPQGRPTPPPADTTADEQEFERARIRGLIRPFSLDPRTLVILGAGTVHLRKGVDLFLACAARVRQLSPTSPVRFVWVGPGFDPEGDAGYSVYLQDQLTRAGLESHVTFIGEVADIDAAYALTDIFLLSSRLDPLPNVAIDAMALARPVVCFDQATGIAQTLAEGGLAEHCVAPYLDVEAAAHRLVRLIEQPALRKRVGEQSQSLAAQCFDMDRYVASLTALARDTVKAQVAEQCDGQVIAADQALRLDFCPHPAWPTLSYGQAIRAFVRSWASGVDLRKPFPGFHPGLYRHLHGLSQPGRNPLADFIEQGRPTGPWLREVITPQIPVPKSPLPGRIALHIHVHYPELFAAILKPLESQDLDLDLLISVSSAKALPEIEDQARQSRHRLAALDLVPNRGRDLGPLLTLYGERLVRDYDFIGHVHTKRSVAAGDVRVGTTWLNFLIENLLGGQQAMATRILHALHAEPRLGLIFPDDPYVVGWTRNRPESVRLAARLGLKDVPEEHFFFPVGSMFWARTVALAPLLGLGMRWEDYPLEPLAYDGTLLHALERLLPSIAQQAGYEFRLCNVPGITR